jgi:uncharacterized protein (DUF1499 family)
MLESRNTFFIVFATMLSTGILAMGDEPSSRIKISSCPDKPNCVSSLEEDKDRRVPPLAYSGDMEQARGRILEILKGFDRIKIVVSEKDYIHAESRSALFRFVDDVQFYFPPGEKIVHVKSAARSGYYDFGVNRKRIDRIREKFETP